MQGSSSAYLRIDTAIDAMGPPASTPFGIIRRHVMSKFDRCFGKTLPNPSRWMMCSGTSGNDKRARRRPALS
jgi:hypothetical protein